ncbi:bifunctional aminoglycoside phosphotransferase/ATP-binding protein [Pseudomonas profundi]|uniref:bifunctional aminoglycoside phosphotransferase/ATP-binding protein n=1 Tax=Pseudomonas profundi TaxID=1981513 RepID=UPI001239601F|nr:bifunctional aminoglycoside phosphotransferase/ATP-binding protein [Pseudomonas profundi]
MSQTLLNALQDPALYDHPVSGFTLMETHISWVLLTGDYVYKIKKPVNFGFLDYSSLEQRAHYCKEELRLNRRLAPELYLDVIPVRGSESSPTLRGEGQIIEYMVKTRQFRQEDLLGNMQQAGTLTAEHIDSLARTLADFHGRIDCATLDSTWGEPEQVHAPVAQNFEHIRSMLSDAKQLAQIEQLELWAHSTFQRLIPQLAQRKAEGFIRECHGDIYLDNVTMVDGKVTLFDCIEFNEAFRWIDVMSDVAFMAMDIEDRGLPTLAQRFVNAYLEHTGDYAGLLVLNYYKAYRAMVRAKVALLRLGQPGITDSEHDEVMARFQGYVNLAESYTHIPQRFGSLMHGVSGSGKSTLTGQLVEHLGVIRIRSDTERKRLFGIDGAGKLDAELYAPERTQQTYARLGVLAAQVLAAGYPVVVDATHLKRDQRALVRQHIEEQGAPCLIIACKAPLETIEAWITKRAEAGNDPSDATIDIVRHQLETMDALDEEESQHSLTVQTDKSQSMQELVATLRKRL